MKDSLETMEKIKKHCYEGDRIQMWNEEILSVEHMIQFSINILDDMKKKRALVRRRK
jgi:hypothetical protein